MKHLIIFVFLFCSCIAYGQDLIVTTTGDSLHCKIIEVTLEQIQFRFGPGRIIPIKRSEVASYKYNFVLVETDDGKTRQNNDATTKTKEKKEKTEKMDKTVNAYSAFLVTINGGASTYGTVSFGKINSGGSAVFGADVAYFFMPWLGAGLKFNTLSCNVDFGEKRTYSDMVMLFGPALHARYEKNKFVVTACTAVCGINWKLSDHIYDSKHIDNQSNTSIGGFFSAGVNYRFTNNVGLGLNVQSAFGTVKDKETKNIERNLTGVGFTMGIHFNF